MNHPPERSELSKHREEYWNYFGKVVSGLFETYPNFKPADINTIYPDDRADGVASLGISDLPIAYYCGQGRILASRFITTNQAIGEGLVPESGIRAHTSDPSDGRDTSLHYYVSVNGNVALIAADVDFQFNNRYLQDYVEREGNIKRRSPFPKFDLALRNAARPLPGAVFAMRTSGPGYNETGIQENKWHLLHYFRRPEMPGYEPDAPWNEQPEAIAGLLTNPDFERAMRRIDKVAWGIGSEILYEQHVAANVRLITGIGLIAGALYSLGSTANWPEISIRSSAEPDAVNISDISFSDAMYFSERLGDAYEASVRFGDVIPQLQR